MIVDVPQFLTLRRELPVVDVRSESEFLQGHIPFAINIPILNDSERVIVGTTYKREGQLQAIREGFRLVGPRLVDIVGSAEGVGHEFIVHCWRGGMRSGNFCQFVGMAGVKTHQLKGGYKAYRKAALNSFQHKYNFLVLSGFTGSGKTEILNALKEHGEQVVDLEGLANHKGSAFGGLGQLPQPTTEQFQNYLFENLISLDPTKRIWVEDESIAVGKIFLPGDFWSSLSVSPVIIVDVERDVRVRRLVAEYGDADKGEFAKALQGITRKLGGQHYNAAMEQLRNNNMSEVIDIILNYYDKAYGNSMERKKERVKLTIEWDGSSVDKIAKSLINEADELEKQEIKIFNGKER